MKIPVQTERGFHIIRPEGDLTINILLLFRKTVDEILEQGFFKIAVDFTNIGKIDSSMIGLLRGLNVKITLKSGTLCLFGVRPQIRELLAITDLDEEFCILMDKKEFEQKFPA